MSRWNDLPWTLRQVQYALAVEQTGGFGLAASLCGVSQPSLSAQVAKLEEGLGVVLFERHARGVLPTAAGRRVLADMRIFLDRAQGVQSQADAQRDPFGVPLRVGIIPTVAPYVLPATVGWLQSQDPSPVVHWLELQTSACEAMLHSGELDAMVIADPATVPSVEEQSIGSEAFLVVAPTGLFDEGPVTMEQLSTHPLLLLEDGHCLRTHTLELCSAPWMQVSPYRATSLPTLVQMVAAGLGVSILPETAVRVETGRAEVGVHPFDGARTIYVIWRSRSPRGEALAVLRDGLYHGMSTAKRH